MAKFTAEEKQAYAAILRAQGGDVSESRLEGEKGKTRTPAGPAGRRGSGAVQVADAGCFKPSRRPPMTKEGKLLVVTPPCKGCALMPNLNWDRAHNETRGRPQDRKARESVSAGKTQRLGSASAEDFAAAPAVRLQHDPQEGCLRPVLGAWNSPAARATANKDIRSPEIVRAVPEEVIWNKV
jgi:hypothetical protein